MDLFVISNQLLYLLQGAIMLNYFIGGFHELHCIVKFMLILFCKWLYYHEFGLVIITQQLLQGQIMLCEYLMNDWTRIILRLSLLHLIEYYRIVLMNKIVLLYLLNQHLVLVLHRHLLPLLLKSLFHYFQITKVR